MKSTREIALCALYDIEYNGAYSNMALKSALNGDIKRQDKAFITQLTYGVVRRKLTLDYIITQYSDIKLKKLSKFVLLILRMGIYQLWFMDKVPESAAVNESVKLAKRYCSKSAGFVNGVLHSVIRGKETFSYPSDKIEELSVRHSFSEDMVKVFSKLEFGEELMKSLNDEPKMTIRINTLKGEELEIDGAELEKVPEYKYARYVSGIDIASCREYREGRFIAQGVAAMMASLALNPKPGQFCIDVCAAPGGKTTHIAELMQNKGRVLAFDIHEHKTDIIAKNAQRMGIYIIETKCHDASELVPELVGTADRVLADVPCSGLGIIRSKPDIKWNKENRDELPVLQYRILETAAKYLKVGGELVYSTCTIDKRENEEVICEFVKNHHEYEFVKVELSKPLARENEGYITLYPNIDNTDGFFISKIKRCM